MQLGPVRFSVDPKRQAARRPFEHVLVVRETEFWLDGATANAGIQGVYRKLAADEARNRLIIDDVIRALEEGRFPILLTERRNRLEYFAEQLRGFVRHLVILRGGMSPKERRQLGARLTEVPDDEERLVLATGRYAGEGFDDARLEVRIFDYVDRVEETTVEYDQEA